MQIVRGLAYIISDGKAVGIEDERFFTLGYATGLVCRRLFGSRSFVSLSLAYC